MVMSVRRLYIKILRTVKLNSETEQTYTYIDANNIGVVFETQKSIQ